jgi:hypothetical protein
VEQAGWPGEPSAGKREALHLPHAEGESVGHLSVTDVADKGGLDHAHPGFLA